MRRNWTATALLGVMAFTVLGCSETKHPIGRSFHCALRKQDAGHLPNVKTSPRIFRPVALKEVLLLPHYSAYDWRGRTSERVVARPFLYRPETPLVVPAYRPGFKLRGVVAVAPGYFATGVCILREWANVGTIDGVECQLVPIMKARDGKKQTEFCSTLSTCCPRRKSHWEQPGNPLTIGENERHVYALSTDFMTPCDDPFIRNGGSVVSFYLWHCEHGTKLSVDLTAEEIKTVNGFFDKYLKMASLATKKRPAVPTSQSRVGQ